MTETVTDNVTEEWRPIPGAPGYEASTEGRIRGRRGRVLTPVRRGGPGGQDYLAVWIYSGSKKSRYREYVHILVCKTFHGRRPRRDSVVSHKDDNKENCRPDNLEWSSHLHNNHYRRRKYAA